MEGGCCLLFGCPGGGENPPKLLPHLHRERAALRATPLPGRPLLYRSQPWRVRGASGHGSWERDRG